MTGRKDFNLRKGNQALPGDEELDRILAAEEFRPLPLGKESIHYPRFDSVVALFDSYDQDTKLFADDDLDIHDVVSLGKQLLDQVVPVMLAKAPTLQAVELFNEAYDYLAEEDKPKPSDLMFVFGAKTPLRAEKAAQLYLAGLSKRIMVSGGSPIYAPSSSQAEAQNYKDLLIAAGVPEQAVLLEDKSITVPDNVRRSLNLLDVYGAAFQSIILVNSPYVQRRGWAIFKKTSS